MEKRGQRGLIYVLATLGLIILAFAFMPLKIAVGMAGLEGARFSARDITGSLWRGRIEQARIGPFALGDLDARARFFPLLAGKITLDLKRVADCGSGLTAIIGKQGDDVLLENASTMLSMGQVLTPLPVTNIMLEDVSARFSGGRCQSASGRVRVSLDTNIPGLDLQQGLLGNAICEDGVLVLPLSSGSGMEELTLKLEGNGFYTARLYLNGNERAWTLLLPTLGFQQLPGGYAMTIAGTLGDQLGQKR
ncbi:type II secretion system protein N [Parasphingorhabdus sp. JC815]|uniref:type II secretion system protein N n=1 Tax=Parasphingorhabdus sp. JC815 TaxID=3232140 RepID=UPI00345B00DD